MNKLFTSTLLTVVAVPFLFAAPTVAKKTQNQAPTSTAMQSSTTKTKKHAKKTKTTATSSTAASAPPQK